MGSDADGGDEVGGQCGGGREGVEGSGELGADGGEAGVEPARRLPPLLPLALQHHPQRLPGLPRPVLVHCETRGGLGGEGGRGGGEGSGTQVVDVDEEEAEVVDLLESLLGLGAADEDLDEVEEGGDEGAVEVLELGAGVGGGVVEAADVEGGEGREELLLRVLLHPEAAVGALDGRRWRRGRPLRHPLPVVVGHVLHRRRRHPHLHPRARLHPRLHPAQAPPSNPLFRLASPQAELTERTVASFAISKTCYTVTRSKSFIA